MTKVDPTVIHALIREAGEALDEMRKLTSLSLDEFVSSTTYRFSLRYSVVLIVEALADIAVAILEKDYGVAPRSYREAFIKLAEKGVVRPGLALKMADLASLRN